MSKVKIEIDKKALNSLGNEAVRNLVANTVLNVECPQCKSAVSVSSGEGVCPCCGYHLSVIPPVG